MTATTRDLELQRTWHEEDYKGFVDFLHGYLGNLAHKFGLKQVSYFFRQTKRETNPKRNKLLLLKRLLRTKCSLNQLILS